MRFVFLRGDGCLSRSVLGGMKRNIFVSYPTNCVGTALFCCLWGFCVLCCVIHFRGCGR